MSLNLGNMWNKSRKNKVILNTNIRKASKPNKIIIPKPTSFTSNNINKPGTKSFWGMPTWLLFHALAEKANEKKYAIHYKVVWEFIKDICGGLPCPYCQSHAIGYVSRIPLHNVNTKEKLKKVLFDFHNSVNIRSGHSRESISILEKYKSANLKKILELFIKRFFVSYIGTRQFNDWYKNQLKEKTYKFWDFYLKNLI